MNYPSTYGSYTLLEPLGQGGMSAIDLAQTSVTKAQFVRFLVIKRIQNKYSTDDSFIQMFQDEARISAELQHANIAQVFDFGEVGSEYYIAMEYIPGVDLREVQKAVVSQRTRIPIRITLKILADVLEALHYAHTRVDMYGQPMNIVHRDANPRNIMLSIRGEVKLIDFGVAKASTKIAQTIGHALKGKFAYMAPEQIEGLPLDGRADLFSMGLTLFEMLENRRPFSKMNEMQIMHRILSGNIPPITDPVDYPKPKLIHDIYNKSLKVNRDERFSSAREMKQALVEAAQVCGGLATEGEVAAFLRSVLPHRIDSISERLNSYRQEVTQPSIITAPPPIKKKVADLEANKATMVRTEQPPVATAKVSTRWIALAIILIGFGIAITWMYFQGNQEEPEKQTTNSRSQQTAPTQSTPPPQQKPAEPQIVPQTEEEKVTTPPETTPKNTKKPSKKDKPARGKNDTKKKAEPVTKTPDTLPKEPPAEGAQEEPEPSTTKQPANEEQNTEEEPPAKGIAWVNIYGDPSVKLYLGGRLLGNLSLTERFPLGTHELRFEKGGVSKTTQVTIKDRSPVTIKAPDF